MLKLRNRRFISSIKFLTIFIIGFASSVIYLSYSDFCKSTSVTELSSMKLLISKPKNFLSIIIFSAPENSVRRMIIRKTWLLTEQKIDSRHVFVIGSASLNTKQKKSLLSEQAQFGDLLLLETMTDSFPKLSTKLLKSFQWLDNHTDFNYLLKVDDDSFVNLNGLYSKMLLQERDKLYWGFFDGRGHAKKKGKWQENNWFLCDRYLPYALGGGYILTHDLIKLVVSVSRHLYLYQNEDVSLGTWLSPYRIKRLHDPLFDTESSSRGCNNSYLITHKQSTDMMISKYNNILKTGKMCLNEYKSRNSYIYNWNNLPSECCNRDDSNIP